MLEYEYALNYMLWGRWDDLFTVMIRTKDHFLQKKIEHFLTSYYYPNHQADVEETHDELIHYLEHAMASDHVKI